MLFCVHVFPPFQIIWYLFIRLQGLGYGNMLQTFHTSMCVVVRGKVIIKLFRLAAAADVSTGKILAVVILGWLWGTHEEKSKLCQFSEWNVFLFSVFIKTTFLRHRWNYLAFLHNNRTLSLFVFFLFELCTQIRELFLMFTFIKFLNFRSVIINEIGDI